MSVRLVNAAPVRVELRSTEQVSWLFIKQMETKRRSGRIGNPQFAALIVGIQTQQRGRQAPVGCRGNSCSALHITEIS